MSTQTRIYPVFIPLAFVLGLLAGYLTWGRTPRPAFPVAAPTPSAVGNQAGSNTARDGAQDANPDGEDTQQVVRYDVPLDDDPVLGPADAPITIIEFSDYECPYCRKWHVEVFGPLLETFPDQIRFVYRDFPLTSIHPNAVAAAEAANCAGDQDMYWEFNELLYSGSQGLGPETYIQYAKSLKINLDEFNECTASRRHQDEVMADLEWAANLGVRSTPTFFLNGIAIVGAQPYETFKQVIEKELAGEIP